MVSAPTASTTSLSQHISDEFSLSKQIQETFNTTSMMSKRLDEMASDYQRLATSFQMPNLETQQMMLDSMRELAEMMPRRSRALQNTMKDVEPLFSKTVQKSLRPASVSTATEANVGNTLSRQSASHEIGESPSTTEPEITTPEVAIGEFPSNSETPGTAIISWIVDSRSEIYALLALSIGGGFVILYSPEEIKWHGIVIGYISGKMIDIALGMSVLDDE